MVFVYLRAVFHLVINHFLENHAWSLKYKKCKITYTSRKSSLETNYREYLTTSYLCKCRFAACLIIRLHLKMPSNFYVNTPVLRPFDLSKTRRTLTTLLSFQYKSMIIISNCSILLHDKSWGKPNVFVSIARTRKQNFFLMRNIYYYYFL